MKIIAIVVMCLLMTASSAFSTTICKCYPSNFAFGEGMQEFSTDLVNSDSIKNLMHTCKHVCVSTHHPKDGNRLFKEGCNYPSGVCVAR